MLPDMPRAFQPIGAILQTVVQRQGLAVKLLEHQLWQRWPEIAGPQIAAHSRPDQIRFRKLTLFVQSSVWLQQLLFLKPSLIEKINARAGSVIVTDIVLRVGDIGQPLKDSWAESARPPEPTPAGVSKTTALLASIAEDPQS